MCPYMAFHNGQTCTKYVPIEKDRYEYKKAADTFWYTKRELNFDDYPELREMFKDEWFDGGFPDSTERIAEILKTSAGLDEIKTITQKLSDMYDENSDITQFRWYNPHKINNILADLYITRKNFAAQELTYTLPERFISNDEINQLFQRGSNISESKYTIYTSFDAHSDKAERIKFLKDHYGIGGSYTGLYNENHDAKGITFSHGDLTKPYAKITLKWNEVEKRVDRLIKSRNYLNEAEIKNIPNYEKEQVAHSVCFAYEYDITEDTVIPYSHGSGYYQANDMLLQKLGDKAHTQTMLSDLKELFAQAPHDARSYPLRMLQWRVI